MWAGGGADGSTVVVQDCTFSSNRVATPVGNGASAVGGGAWLGFGLPWSTTASLAGDGPHATLTGARVVVADVVASYNSASCGGTFGCGNLIGWWPSLCSGGSPPTTPTRITAFLMGLIHADGGGGISVGVAYPGSVSNLGISFARVVASHNSAWGTLMLACALVSGSLSLSFFHSCHTCLAPVFFAVLASRWWRADCVCECEFGVELQLPNLGRHHIAKQHQLT
jgi:hypothetical protein